MAVFLQNSTAKILKLSDQLEFNTILTHMLALFITKKLEKSMTSTFRHCFG